MKEVRLMPLTKSINGEVFIPGDKSISHRAVMLGSLASGTTTITNFLDGDDCMHTIKSFQEMGVSIQVDGTTVVIESEGIMALQEPKIPLYFGNSGTTARLMLGVLAGLPFFSTIYGDPYLTDRPMNRVINPLTEMGLVIDGRDNGSLLPLSIRGGELNGITYKMPVKSAQVKSAILLAGLFAKGTTTVIENGETRDHTEKMLQAFGADIDKQEDQIKVTNKSTLSAVDVQVPGDISSAAFFLVAAAIVNGSKLTLRNIGLNKTRIGIIEVLEQMGSNLSIENERDVNGEMIGDVTITYRVLQGITIEGEVIPRLIDEIPVIALLATQASGTTVIKNAEELRVKETDRIAAVVDVLSTLGANITPTEDGMIIEGGTPLTGGNIKSYHDHRIAMMGVIASLIASDTVTLDDTSSIAVSYPNFFTDLEKIVK